MSDSNVPVGTRPLAKVVPDHGQLLADPASFLAQREVRIGPQRVQWPMFLIVPVLFILGMYLIPNRLGWALVFVSPILLCVLVYWAWPVHREMVLSKNGIELIYQESRIWCPWALFSAEGQAFVA